ncbi:MAG: hypothetical protein AAFX55_17860 [Bacteroidota bacterium]
MTRLIVFLVFVPLCLNGQIEMTPTKWKQDLTYLHKTLEERHANLYHSISKEDFGNGIENLIRLSHSLDDKELIVRMSELLARVGDAHTWLHPGYQDSWEFQRLPIKLNYFEDGLFITATDKAYKDLIGSQLLAINSIDVKGIKSQISQVGYNENAFTQLISYDRFIVITEVLKRFGIIDDLRHIPLTIKNESGTKEVVVNATTLKNIDWLSHSDIEKNLPIVYKHNDSLYWTHYNKIEHTYYVQLNSIDEDENHSFKQLAEDVLSATTTYKPKKLVIDLRRNVGGNSRLVYPLIYALMHYEKTIEDGQIFVIIGRWTLSASIVTCAEIHKYCNPIFIGEPTGAKPNLYGENSHRITLPNSGLSISYSSEYFKPFGPFIDEDWISPHIYVPIPSQDYFSFKQPILEAIYQYESPRKHVIDEIYELAMNASIDAALQVYFKFRDDPKNKYVDISNDLRRVAGKIGRNEKLDDSRRLYEQLHLDHPNNSLISVNLAQLYEDLKQLPKAIALYKKTLGLFSRDRKTDNYLKHYIEDYITGRLRTLDHGK